MLKALRRRFRRSAPDLLSDPMEHARWLSETLARTDRAFEQATRKAEEREAAVDRQPRTPRPVTVAHAETRLAHHLQQLRATITEQRAARTPVRPGTPAGPHDFARAEAHLESLESMLRDMEEERDRAADAARTHLAHAEAAVRGGEDALAREALAHHRLHDRTRAALTHEIATHRAVFAELRAAIQKLNPDGQPPR